MFTVGAGPILLVFERWYVMMIMRKSRALILGYVIDQEEQDQYWCAEWIKLDEEEDNKDAG